MTKDELIELLADKEHAGWAHWMKYLFQKCGMRTDGSVLIPLDLVDRWQRQVITPYASLSEREKQSDRDEVAKILPIIEAWDHKPFDICCIPFCGEETVYKTFVADELTNKGREAAICEKHFAHLPNRYEQRTKAMLLTIALRDAVSVPVAHDPLLETEIA